MNAADVFPTGFFQSVQDRRLVNALPASGVDLIFYRAPLTADEPAIERRCPGADHVDNGRFRR